jgi:hypothetical protein
MVLLFVAADAIVRYVFHIRGESAYQMESVGAEEGGS